MLYVWVYHRTVIYKIEKKWKRNRREHKNWVYAIY